MIQMKNTDSMNANDKGGKISSDEKVKFFIQFIHLMPVFNYSPESNYLMSMWRRSTTF